MATRTAVASRRKDSVTSRGGGGENFKVAVRVRPLIEREIRSGAPQVRIRAAPNDGVYVIVAPVQNYEFCFRLKSWSVSH